MASHGLPACTTVPPWGFANSSWESALFDTSLAGREPRASGTPPAPASRPPPPGDVVAAREDLVG